MKKLLIAVALVMALAGGKAWAENYTIVIAPNGKTCRHINIENEQGVVVDITTKDEVRKPTEEYDSEALKQVKAFFKNTASQSLLNTTAKTIVDIQKAEVLNAEER